MRSFFYTSSIFLVLICVVSACRPPGFEIGGGGSTHTPPKELIYGKDTDIKLELSVWGEGSGKMRDRWKDVTFHYKTNLDFQFRSIPMHPDKEEHKRIYFSCKLPPIKDVNAQSVTYYFDMLFDGHYNKHEEGPIPLRHNAAEQGAAANP